MIAQAFLFRLRATRSAGILPAPSARGFTLIEILAAMAILLVGLASVVSVVLGSSRFSNAAARRNVAAIIISEAVEDIQRRHLITSTNYGYSADKVGLLIETLKSPNPSVHTPNANVPDGVALSNLVTSSDPMRMATWNLNLQPLYLTPRPPPDAVNTLVWPLGISPKYFAGPAIQSNSGVGPDTSTPLYGNTAYRVIYRLERHPEWQPHTTDPQTAMTPFYWGSPVWQQGAWAATGNTASGTAYGPEVVGSPFAGMYVLTLAVYHDPTSQCASLEQVCDPVVVYLRDKKAR